MDICKSIYRLIHSVNPGKKMKTCLKYQMTKRCQQSSTILTCMHAYEQIGFVVNSGKYNLRLFRHLGIYYKQHHTLVLQARADTTFWGQFQVRDHILYISLNPSFVAQVKIILTKAKRTLEKKS